MIASSDPNPSYIKRNASLSPKAAHHQKPQQEQNTTRSGRQRRRTQPRFQPSLCKLPGEIWIRIFEYVNPHDFAKTLSTCCLWYNMGVDGALWKFYAERFTGMNVEARWNTFDMNNKLLDKDNSESALFWYKEFMEYQRNLTKCFCLGYEETQIPGLQDMFIRGIFVNDDDFPNRFLVAYGCGKVIDVEYSVNAGCVELKQSIEVYNGTRGMMGLTRYTSPYLIITESTPSGTRFILFNSKKNWDVDYAVYPGFFGIIGNVICEDAFLDEETGKLFMVVCDAQGLAILDIQPTSMGISRLTTIDRNQKESNIIGQEFAAKWVKGGQFLVIGRANGTVEVWRRRTLTRIEDEMFQAYYIDFDICLEEPWERTGLGLSLSITNPVKTSALTIQVILNNSRKGSKFEIDMDDLNNGDRRSRMLHDGYDYFTTGYEGIVVELKKFSTELALIEINQSDTPFRRQLYLKNKSRILMVEYSKLNDVLFVCHYDGSLTCLKLGHCKDDGGEGGDKKGMEVKKTFLEEFGDENF